MVKYITLLLMLIPAFAHSQVWRELGPVEFPKEYLSDGNWSAVGLGRYQVVEVHPNDTNILYAGSCAGGIFKTTDGGKNWENINNGIISMGVNDIAIDPKKPDVIYIATGTTCFEHGFGVGVLVSKNGGRTWNETGLKFEPRSEEIVERIVIHPKDNKKLIATTKNSIYISEDKGDSWTEVFTKKGNNFADVEYLTANPNVIFASGKRLYVSVNKGETWEDITPRLSGFAEGYENKEKKARRIEVAIDPVNSKRVVIVYNNGKDYVEEMSYPEFTLTTIAQGYVFNRSDENHMELELGYDGKIYLGCVRLTRLDGNSPRQVTSPLVGDRQFVHDDIKEVKIVKQGSRELIFIATDGGIYKSSNKGEDWENISGKGLGGALFYGLHQKNGKLIGGTQDNSSYLYENGEWKHMSRMYCDGGNGWILNNGYLLAACNSKLYGSSDTGRSWQQIHPSAKSYGYDFDIEVINDSIVFVHNQYEVFRGILGENKRIKWEHINSGYSVRHGITHMSVSSTNPDIIMFADQEPTWNPNQLKNKFWLTRDGGKTWKDLTSKLGILAWKDIEDMQVDPYNDNRMWVCMGGFDAPEYRQYVYYTEDGGETWEHYSEGLPNFTTNCLAYYDGAEETLFLGTHAGLFYRNNLTQKWVKLGYGLPDCIISDIEVDTVNKKLYVATYGRGVWECDISNL